jgi:hypothetical protein
MPSLQRRGASDGVDCDRDVTGVWAQVGRSGKPRLDLGKELRRLQDSTYVNTSVYSGAGELHDTIPKGFTDTTSKGF